MCITISRITGDGKWHSNQLFLTIFLGMCHYIICSKNSALQSELNIIALSEFTSQIILLKSDNFLF